MQKLLFLSLLFISSLIADELPQASYLEKAPFTLKTEDISDILDQKLQEFSNYGEAPDDPFGPHLRNFCIALHASMNDGRLKKLNLICLQHHEAFKAVSTKNATVGEIIDQWCRINKFTKAIDGKTIILYPENRGLPSPWELKFPPHKKH